MSEKVLMQDLVDALARDRKITKREAETFVKALFDLIKEALESDQYIKVKGLGTFKLINISSRESVNVNTGERFIIGGHTRISFTPDPAMRDLVNKPFAHFETVVLNDGVAFSDTPEEESAGAEKFEEESGAEEIAEPVAEEEPVTDETVTAPSAPQDPSGQESPSVTGEPIAGQPESVPADEPAPEHPDVNPAVETTKQAENMKLEDKQGLPYFIAIVAIILVVLSGTIIYVYKPGLLLDMLPASARQTPEATDSVGVSSPVADTVQTVPADTLTGDSAGLSAKSAEMPFDKVLREVREEKAVKQESPANTARTASASPGRVTTGEPVNPDSTNYLITGTRTTYTLQPGETLTMVSKRFYGTKDLWPYIARHNPELIKNPDKVPFGTTLRIPELKKK